MKPINESIRKIVNRLNDENADGGGFWLPNIQRSFVWKEEQIEKLFDSIMRQYPISTLLAWKTKQSMLSRRFIDNYKYRQSHRDFFVPINEKTKTLVLDGQQRLQSLFIGLRGSYDGKELYFNILSGQKSSPEDIRYEFKFRHADAVTFPFLKFKNLVDSNSMSRVLHEKIIAESGTELSQNQKDIIQDNIDMMNHTFKNSEAITYLELDSIDEPEKYSEDDVVEIFIRANDGGTALSKSDLLFSLLTSAWDGAEEEMEDLIKEINNSGYKFNRDFILKSCLTVLDQGARYQVAKFREADTKQQISENWTEITKAVKEVKDFIYGSTYIRSDHAMPSYLGLIPIIYFRYKYPEKWKASERLDEYLLRVLLTSAFSGTPDNLIDKCTDNIDAIENFDVPQIFGVIREDGRTLEVTPQTILSAHYTSREIHLLFNIWYRDFNYQPAYENGLPQIDHIFPQSLLKSIKDENPETGKMNIMRYKWPERDQIGNCMLLTREENGAGGKSDISPEVWFADKEPEYLEKHLIPKDKELWKLKNYELFIEARNKLILEKFDFLLVDQSRV